MIGSPSEAACVLKAVRRPSPMLLRKLSVLFESVGMRSRRVREMSRAIRFSDLSIGAFHGPRLVGFGRLVSDRAYYATLWDVAVDREFQRAGIGRAIVSRLLERAATRNLVMVGLFTSIANDSFYRRLNFRRLTNIHPMTSASYVFRNRSDR